LKYTNFADLHSSIASFAPSWRPLRLNKRLLNENERLQLTAFSFNRKGRRERKGRWENGTNRPGILKRFPTIVINYSKSIALHLIYT
jgi:hypothetical protein